MTYKTNLADGFTLLEVMVALAILAFSLVSLLTANNRALTLSAEAADLTDAVTLARAAMENIVLDPPKEPGESEPEINEGYPALIVKSEVMESEIPDVSEAKVIVYKKEGTKEIEIFTLTAFLGKEKKRGRGQDRSRGGEKDRSRGKRGRRDKDR